MSVTKPTYKELADALEALVGVLHPGVVGLIVEHHKKDPSALVGRAMVLLRKVHAQAEGGGAETDENQGGNTLK